MREADCMAVRRAAVLLAALLMGVVTVSGCGGSETETSPTTTHTITRTATVPSATGTIVSTTATTKPGGHACTNLRLTESVRAQLLDGKLDAGSVYYGKCGDTYWAIGHYTGPIGGEGYRFRRKSGQRRWENLGGVSDESHLCGVPRPLLRIWMGTYRPNYCS
jgi:hypothetical protein